MKILTPEQIKEADKITIDKQGITSAELMRRAGDRCADWLIQKFSSETRFAIICGPGNNGGDGIVIAENLIRKKYHVVVSHIHQNSLSVDHKVHLDRLKESGFNNFKTVTDSLESADVVIDCIFGIGLNRPVEGEFKEAIELINKSALPVISIDIPSGLPSFPVEKEAEILSVAALHTLTFNAPKLSFLLPVTGRFVNNFSVIDIELDQEFIQSAESNYYFFTEADVKPLIRKRPKFSHKGTYGHALLAGGSTGKFGAIILSSLACLRSGAGLTTVRIPTSGVPALNSFLPEAMTEINDDPEFVTTIKNSAKYSAIGFGPGAGTDQKTAGALKVLIQEYKGSLVIDADGLNILSENKTWLSYLPANTILTPHPGEFSRLVGKWDNDKEKLDLLKEFCRRFNVTVILKDAHTCICTPGGKFFFNSTGNPSLAKGGSGDVLTGILTSLLAQGYGVLTASILGVFIHGRAADIASSELHENSVLARDVCEKIPDSLRSIEK